MNITLSIDDKVVNDVRKIAQDMGKSLNQMVREYLEQLTRQQQANASFEEFLSLSGQGNSNGWKFNRDELHERA